MSEVSASVPQRVNYVILCELRKGYRTKFELLLPFLDGVNDSEPWISSQVSACKPCEPCVCEDLVAMVDGEDIFWGGCSMEHFIEAYLEIVNRSGAPIVFSAEVACGEQDCWHVPKARLL